MYCILNNVDSLKTAAVKEGMAVRTLGYYLPGDGGGAEYVVQRTNEPVDTGSTIALEGGLQAQLIVQDHVNYKMFGARSDGSFDDGIAIKKAHDYANGKQLPVINPAGEFWIKHTCEIEISTPVDWGMSVFHIDEAYNRKDAAKFIVAGSREAIQLDQSHFPSLLPRLKKGQHLIPELKDYANHLAFVRDDHSRVGFRRGESDKSWAMEDFFYIEEHGRILGEVTWDFTGLTHVELIPCDPNYLVIQGGTFYLNGTNSGDNGAYKWCGFQVKRSRTIIRNQVVMLEPGNTDTATDPRRGFYALQSCYDITMENIRLLPFEKERGGNANVPNGTYGIFGNRVLNPLFRNITAEGSLVHWGVIGTNLFKNFRIENCRLNRIDVHFHCHNLYVRDCDLGYNGLTITGGGDLWVENTKVVNNNFIQFRKDYGSRWDGDILIRNCKLIVPRVSQQKAILVFNHENKNYGYDIQYGKTVKIEDFMIDYTFAPEEESDIHLMYIPDFEEEYVRPVHYPTRIVLKDISVAGRQKGVQPLASPTLTASPCKVFYERVDVD